MIMEKLIKRIGLQFFAEDDEDLDEDFEDDFDDVPEFYGWDHDDEDEPDTEQSDDDSEGDVDGGSDSDGDADDGGESEDEAEDSAEEEVESEEDLDGASSSTASGPPSPDLGKANESAEGADNGNEELISELKALGYVGDDLASLTADIKKRRENAEKNAASEERRARNAEGKGHVSSSRPGKTAGGDGAGGFSSKQVRNLQQTLGCSYEKARDLLAKQVRAIG